MCIYGVRDATSTGVEKIQAYSREKDRARENRNLITGFLDAITHALLFLSFCFFFLSFLEQKEHNKKMREKEERGETHNPRELDNFAMYH